MVRYKKEHRKEPEQRSLMSTEWWQIVGLVAAVVVAVIAAYRAGRSAKSAEAAAGTAARAAADELYERLKSNDFAHVHKDIQRLDAKIDITAVTLNNKIDSTAATLNRKTDSTAAILNRKIDSTAAILNEKIDATRADLEARITRGDDRLRETRLELKGDILASESRLLKAIQAIPAR